MIIAPEPPNIVANTFIQNFTAIFRKPLNLQSLNDIKIQPNTQYNITSYWGCYKRTSTTTTFDYDNGIDPNVYYSTDGSYGCGPSR